MSGEQEFKNIEMGQGQPFNWRKWTMIGLGIIALLSSIFAAVFSYQEKQTLEASKALEILLTSEKTKNEELTKSLTEERSQRKHAENKFKNIHLARYANGDPVFDEHGKPVYEVNEGSSISDEEFKEKVQELMHQKIELGEKLTQKETELSTLKQELIKKGLKPWEFGLGYSQDLSEFGAYTTATYWAGMGYHLAVFGLDLGLNGQLGYGLGGESGLKGMIYVSARP